MRRENRSKCVTSFDHTAYIGQGVFDVLNDILGNNRAPNWEADFKPRTEEMIRKIENLKNKLQITPDSPTLVFREEELSSSEIYSGKPLAQLKEFKFLKDGSDSIGPDTKSVLIFELFLPFNNKHHHDENCVPAKDLPFFFSGPYSS